MHEMEEEEEENKEVGEYLKWKEKCFLAQHQIEFET